MSDYCWCSELVNIRSDGVKFENEGCLMMKRENDRNVLAHSSITRDLKREGTSAPSMLAPSRAWEIRFQTTVYITIRSNPGQQVSIPSGHIKTYKRNIDTMVFEFQLSQTCTPEEEIEFLRKQNADLKALLAAGSSEDIASTYEKLEKTVYERHSQALRQKDADHEKVAQQQQQLVKTLVAGLHMKQDQYKQNLERQNEAISRSRNVVAMYGHALANFLHSEFQPDKSDWNERIIYWTKLVKR